MTWEPICEPIKREFFILVISPFITEWTLVWMNHSGKCVNLAGSDTIVFRRQPDGNWLMVIENPWGTE